MTELTTASMTGDGVPDLLRAPSPEVRTTTRIGRYLDRLAEHRELRFDDCDALHRWSVTDLDGFWSSIRDHFEVREHTPADTVPGPVHLSEPREDLLEREVVEDPAIMEALHVRAALGVN